MHKLNNITTSKLSIGQSATSFDTFVFYGYTYDLDTMDLSTYNPASGAPPVDSLQSSIINVHSWIGGANHSIIPGTSVVTIDSTGTVTSAGKSFYRFHVSAAGAAAINRTVTLADAFSCLDTLGILAGLFNDGGFAITCDNYINIGTTDSANISGTKNITRDFIRGVGSLAKNTNAITRFVGAQNSQITLNQNKMERVRIVKTTSANGAVFLDTPDTLRSLRDSTGYCNDIAGVIVDSTNYFNDSVNIATLKCYDTLNFLTACKGTVTTVSFLGGTAGRCDDSGHLFTTCTVAKTATIPMGFYGLTKATTMTVTTGAVTLNDSAVIGTLTINAGGADTMRSNDGVNITGNAVINGNCKPADIIKIGGDCDITAGYFKKVSGKKISITGDATITDADSVILTDTVEIGENLIFAAGLTKVKLTGCIFSFTGTVTHVITTNGLSMTGIKFIGKNLTFVNAISCIPIISDSGTVTFLAGSTDTLRPGYDIEGSAGKKVMLRSSVPGTRYYISIAAIDTVSYSDFQDCNSITNKIYAFDGTSMNSGNNVNIYFHHGSPSAKSRNSSLNLSTSTNLTL
jgi:hypothetical protein